MASEISDPAAEEYLTRIMIERRDKIVAHWFGKVSPLDGFNIDLDSTGNHIFSFRDLAVEAGVVSSSGNRYMAVVRDDENNLLASHELSENTHFELSDNSKGKNDEQNFAIELNVLRETFWGSEKAVRVYVTYRPQTNVYEVVAIRRDS